MLDPTTTVTFAIANVSNDGQAYEEFCDSLAWQFGGISETVGRGMWNEMDTQVWERTHFVSVDVLTSELTAGMLAGMAMAAKFLAVELGERAIRINVTDSLAGNVYADENGVIE